MNDNDLYLVVILILMSPLILMILGEVIRDIIEALKHE